MISVIVPVYNVESYLKDCIESIVHQTYRDIEVIFVDDGSTDGSSEICKNAINKYPNMRYIYEKNAGVSVARNKGLDEASGEWVCFVDPDDRLDPKMIEVLYSAIDDNIDIICCCAIDFNENEKIEDHFFEESFTAINEHDKSKFIVQLFDSDKYHSRTGTTAIGVPWGKLYRRSYLISNNLKFDPELRRMQDNVFNMSAFYLANGIKYIDEMLYYYRLDHISSSKLISLQNAYNVLDRRQAFINEHIETIDKNILEANYIGTKRLFISSLMNLSLSSIREIINSIKMMRKSEQFSDFFNIANKNDESKVKITKYLINRKMWFLTALILKIYSLNKK